MSSWEEEEVCLKVFQRVGLERQGLTRQRADVGSNSKALCERENADDGHPRAQDGNANFANISS